MTKDGMAVNRADGYAPLEAYAVIGDGRSVALVARDGAIDWFAVPAIDSPPVCAALLDPDDGGAIRLEPTVDYRVTRRYLDRSAVLETTFHTDGGVLRVTDALNRGSNGVLPWTELARRVEVEGAEVPVRWSVAPGHRLGSSQPWARPRDGVPTLLVGDQQLAVVAEGLGEPMVDKRQVHGSTVLTGGTRALLGVVATDAEPLYVPRAESVQRRLDDTNSAWQRWCDRLAYDGPHADSVLRSAITLKLLTLQSSGAIAAAATTSLPEAVGGDRNFDYRFAWVRDMCFCIDAFSRLELHEEVHATLSWLLAAVHRTVPDVHVFYTLDGMPASGDMDDVSALPGWRRTQPVHVGNSAARQKQLGSYGDLLDSVWRYVDRGGQLDTPTGAMLGRLADETCDQWRQQDAGLWELGDYQHYTSSKISCWSALDRAVQLADRGQLPALNRGRWEQERDAIHAWVDEHCWDANRQTYTMHPGTDDLDAAVLLAARTGFLRGDDRRLHATIDAIRAELTADGPLLFRYSKMKGKEGAFIACSFWLVEALTHAGRQQEAADLLEGVLSCSNDVGVFSEEIDPNTRHLLGNLPQALSHLTVINAATAVAVHARG